MKMSMETWSGRVWGAEAIRDARQRPGGAGQRISLHVFCGWRVFGLTIRPRGTATRFRDRLDMWTEDASPAKLAHAAATELERLRAEDGAEAHTR